MAQKTEDAKAAKEEYFSVEELCKKKKTSCGVFAGVCTAEGWRSGKMVTVAQWEAAVEQFLKAPINGRRDK